MGQPMVERQPVTLCCHFSHGCVVFSAAPNSPKAAPSGIVQTGGGMAIEADPDA